MSAAKETQARLNLLWIAAFAAVAVLYLFARLWNLSASCLWFDEIFSVHAAQHAWGDLFRFVALDLIHPPLFYVFLKIWILLGGESIFWLRLFPVLFAILAVPPFFLLCRELKLTKAETLAAFVFLAVNGSLIKYSQEIRMYSPLFCLALVSFWLFAKYFNNASVRTLVWLFFVNLLMIYTHYFGWLAAASELTAILLLKRDKIWQFAASIGLLFLTFAPWIYTVSRAAATNAGFGQNIGWMTKPNLQIIFQFVLSLHEPFYFQQSSADGANFVLISLPLALICISAIAAAFRDGKLRLPAIFAFVPLILTFFASWLLPVSIWGTRHLIIVFAPAALLAAIALNRLRPKGIKFAAFGLAGMLVLVGGIIHLNRRQPVFLWCAWENLARQAIENDKSEIVTIYAFEDLVAYHLWFAVQTSDRVRVVAVKNYPGITEDKSYFLPRGFAEITVADQNALTGERFWIAFRDASWNPDSPLLKDLTTRGYGFGAPLKFDAQGQTAFLVPVERK